MKFSQQNQTTQKPLKKDRRANNLKFSWNEFKTLATQWHINPKWIEQNWFHEMFAKKNINVRTCMFLMLISWLLSSFEVAMLISITAIKPIAIAVIDWISMQTHKKPSKFMTHTLHIFWFSTTINSRMSANFSIYTNTVKYSHFRANTVHFVLIHFTMRVFFFWMI